MDNAVLHISYNNGRGHMTVNTLAFLSKQGIYGKSSGVVRWGFSYVHRKEAKLWQHIDSNGTMRT